MVEKKLTFNVAAKDDASRVFEALAKNASVDMAAVDAAVDKTASKGKQVAQALGATFDQIGQDIKGTQEAAELLGRALGPELASKTDLTSAVQQFKSLGLTVDDVKADVDVLADTIRQADAVTMQALADEPDKVKASAEGAKGEVDALADSVRAADTASLDTLAGSADHAKTKLGDVRGEADNSRSVLANFVGNSAQDLGALGGVAGTAGMAIGQFAEYATEGDIALSGLAKAAGPMIALGLAVKIATDIQGRFSDSTKRTEKDVETWASAIDAGGDAATNYAAKLKDAGEIMVDVTRAQSGLTNVVAEADSHWYTTGVGVHFIAEALGASKDEVKDLTPLLAKAGITAQQFADAAADPHPAQMQAELAAALAKTTLSADDQKLILLGVTQAQEDHATATANAAVTQAVFTTATEGVTQAVKDKAAADATAQVNQEQWRTTMEAATAAQEAQKQAVQDAVDALNDESDALNGQIDAMQSSADATLAANDAQQAFIDAVGESTKVQGDAKATSEDKRDAVDAERDAMIQAANAQRDLTEKNAEAEGKTASATAKVDAFNDTLLANAHYATPAARDAIADYIVKANDVPEEKATEIKAAIAAGDFATADALLDQVSAARQAAIRADADTQQAAQELKELTKDRTVRIIANQVVGTARAVGGISSGGDAPAPVAEYGAELVEYPSVRNLPAGSKVRTAARTQQLLRDQPAASGSVTNLTIIAGGDSAKKALAAYDDWQWRNSVADQRAAVHR